MQWHQQLRNKATLFIPHATGAIYSTGVTHAGCLGQLTTSNCVTHVLPHTSMFMTSSFLAKLAATHLPLTCL
jgi:hypothetical protein